MLLVGFGAAMASIVALAKQAIILGGHPVTLAFYQFLLAGTVLLVYLKTQSITVPWGITQLRFYGWSAVLGIAGPHLLAFLAVQNLGAGLTSAAYIFPPLFTYLMALLFGMERFYAIRGLGLALGLGGSLAIVQALTSSPFGTNESIWVIVLFVIPLSMALGNIYRAKFWPENLSVAGATAAILTASAVLLVGPAFAVNPSAIVFDQSGKVTLIAAAQAVLAAVGYLMFFRLQRVGGPVYLSQAGYIITGLGLLYGASLFAERYDSAVWGGLLIIAAGVSLVTMHQNILIKHKPTGPYSVTKVEVD